MAASTTFSSRVRRVIGSAVLSALLGSSAMAADWPQYRGPKADGHSEDVGIAKAGFKAKPKWKVPIGEGFGTFAVVGDKAAIFVDRGGRETLVVLNADTGKELWARPVDGTITDKQGGSNPRSTPAIVGDKIYVYSVNLKLSCFSLADGKPVWEHDVRSEMNGQNLKWGNAASPIVDGDRVFVGGGGAGKSMAAFDKNDGKLLWAVGGESITHASPTPATIDGVKQIIFFMQSGLVGLAQEDGKELWKASFPYKVSTAASPIVGDGKFANVVYCSAGYDVGSAAFKVTKTGDTFSATQMWFQKSENKQGHNVNHWSTPIYHDGYIYGIFGFKDFASKKGGGAPVGCMDLQTGQFKWRQPGFGSGGGTIYVDGHILVQGDAGKVSLIETTPAGFKETGTFDLAGEKFWCAAIIANGKIYARSRTEAFCIDLK